VHETLTWANPIFQYKCLQTPHQGEDILQNDCQSRVADGKAEFFIEGFFRTDKFVKYALKWCIPSVYTLDAFLLSAYSTA
jgi:hypothetical protein